MGKLGGQGMLKGHDLTYLLVMKLFGRKKASRRPLEKISRPLWGCVTFRRVRKG
jgi:hypothetical protein